MHVDARTLPDPSLIEGDICVIGAGPAGISIALEWANTPYSIVLLEGGGDHVDNRYQQLLRGDSVGQRYYPLETSRLHYFGGTSGHWGGLCSPLDPIDFSKRNWVPDSGWPITYEDMRVYFSRAEQKLELGHGFDLETWEANDTSLKSLPLDKNTICQKAYQFSPPTRFGTRYHEAIEKSKNITLYTHANVVGIDASESLKTITQVRATNFEKKKLRVKARYYVLACGGIENARLLLCSNHQMKTGLGNPYDVVGRYFMDHLEVVCADLMMPTASNLKLYLLDLYITKVRAELAASGTKQAELQILNGSISLMVKNKNNQANIDSFSSDAETNVKMWNQLDRQGSHYDDVTTLHHSMATIKKWYHALHPFALRFSLFMRMEQAPNRHSRIFLNNEKDELGMNRVNLDWKFTPLEKRSMHLLCHLLGQEMGRTGLGRIRLMEWLVNLLDESWPSTLGGGWHHIGTTRMHEDPRKGVVDSNCKVHGIANLYVAGSSVFTTSGAACPTFNLVALALRLSDHLKENFTRLDNKHLPL